MPNSYRQVMQTGADTRLRRDQSDPRIRFSYEAGAGEVLAPCRADTRYWGPNKSMKHKPLDSAIASVLGVRSTGFPMQSTPFLQGIPFLYLALIMGLYLQPAPVFAQDPYQKQGDTNAAAGPPRSATQSPMRSAMDRRDLDQRWHHGKFTQAPESATLPVKKLRARALPPHRTAVR